MDLKTGMLWKQCDHSNFVKLISVFKSHKSYASTTYITIVWLSPPPMIDWHIWLNTCHISCSDAVNQLVGQRNICSINGWFTSPLSQLGLHSCMAIRWLIHAWCWHVVTNSSLQTKTWLMQTQMLGWDWIEETTWGCWMVADHSLCFNSIPTGSI